ncbi:MAG: hypothetical protein K5872_05490 [Rhizobiaceae bacterium]|nr:hypothetical protein [Rhizobiaceae bacterium]MCV0405665.1 hypothetical protein [Rhizobiaceae bacterium]
MSVVDTTSATPGSGFRLDASWLFSRPLLLSCLVLLLAPLLQLRWGTIPDTSWLIHVGEAMLSGERLYIDLFETNPPFSVWLYLPAVTLALRIGVAPELVVHVMVYCAAAVSVAFAGLIQHRSGLAEASAMRRLTPLVLALLVLLPGNAFSEREHIGLILLLPLLALQIWRASPELPKPPGSFMSVTAGLMGSVLFLVKPYFGLAILLPALLAAWRGRSLRPLLAPEYWTIAGISVIYLAAVLTSHPEFLDRIYPMMVDVYAPVRTYYGVLVPYGLMYAILLVVLWKARPSGPVPASVAVPLLASLGSVVPVIIMAKGWPYHAYPAMTLAIIALATLVLASRVARPLDTTWRWIAILVVIGCMSPLWPTHKPSSHIVETIRSSLERPSVTIISNSLSKAFPLVRMIDGRWASLHVCDWLGVSALLLSVEATDRGDEAEAARYRAIADDYIDDKRAEFERARPDIVIVSRDQEYWTGYLRRFGGLDAMLAGYEFLVEDDEIRVLIRGDLLGADAG